MGSLRSKRFHLVLEQRKTEERDSQFWLREMKQEPKNESGGRGRGRKETLADKSLDFENLRSPANAASDWLSYSNSVDMCQSKVCFILRGRYGR